MVRCSDMEEGEAEGLPIWREHVGDPALAHNRTRRIDFAHFMLAAIAAALKDLTRYPDANGYYLKHKLGERFDLDPAGITLGNGSNEVIDLLFHTFVGQGDEVIYAQYAFIVYALATQAHGAKAVVVPARDWGHDLDAMLAAITDKTKLICIANPNNPTGTVLPPAALEAFLAKVPAEILVVLDEAYNEYMDPALRAPSADWVKRFVITSYSIHYTKLYESGSR